MKISFIVAATAATACYCLLPSERALAQTVLDEMSVQIESSDSFLPGAGGRPAITIDDLRAAQSGPAAQPQGSNQAASPPPPDVIGNASDGIGEILNTDRLIDPITGSIDRAVEGISGSVNNGINRALNGALAPVDAAIDRTVNSVNGAIDRALGNVMAPVDKTINDVLAGINKEISRILDGIFGAPKDVAEGVLDEALGGVLEGVFGGGGGRRTVEALYNPTSPVSSIVSAASFQSLLPGVTSPYTEAIPFAVGSMGLPDYTTIRPTLDALITGQQGNPNRTIQGADRFSTTPQTLTMSLSNEVERLGSRSVANATLSQTGQDAMKADLEGATRTLNTAIEIADESQDFDVTQDIMKNLSAQLAQDSVLRAGQYKEDTLARQQAAADSIVITQISQSMDEQNRARRSQSIGNSARMHLAVGQLHLPGEMSDD